MSQNKGFDDSYNSSRRVLNLCTFPSQTAQNKQGHHEKRFRHEFSCS